MFCPAFPRHPGMPFPAGIPRPNYLNAQATIWKALLCKHCYFNSIFWPMADQKASLHVVSCRHTCVWTLEPYCHKIIDWKRSQHISKTLSHIRATLPASEMDASQCSRPCVPRLHTPVPSCFTDAAMRKQRSHPMV